MENLDLAYEVMSLLDGHPEVRIQAPLLIYHVESTGDLQGLCETWEPPDIYFHFSNLEAYRLIVRSGVPAHYHLAPAAAEMLAGVRQRGGWEWVREQAIKRPVRPEIREVCRWVLDGCP